MSTKRDFAAEQQVLQWILGILNQNPTEEFSKFIQDGSILSQVMINLYHNSVPMDMVGDKGGVNPQQDRVKVLLKHIKKYGVDEKLLFEPEDLTEMKNVPRVTKCLLELGKLATKVK